MENSTGTATGAQKSIDELLTEGLGAENKEALDRLLVNLRGMMKSGADYVEENPREAAALAVAVGLAAYIGLATKPGRRAVEIAAIAFLPKIRSWVVQFFKENTAAPNEVSAVESSAAPAAVDTAQALHH